MATTEQFQELVAHPEMRKRPTNRRRHTLVLKTVCIYMGFMCLGMCDSVLGPTFSDIQELLHTDTSHLSAVFTFANIGYLTGSVMAGLLFDRLPPELQLGGALGVAGVSIALAPVQKSLVWFFVAMGIEGAGLAYIDAGTQTYCLSAWRGHKLQDAILQGIFMAWSIGSTIGPLILQPFLTPPGLPLPGRTGPAGECGYHTSISPNILNGINYTDVPITPITHTSYPDIVNLNSSEPTSLLPISNTDMNSQLPNLMFNATLRSNATTQTPRYINVSYGYMLVGFILVPVSLLYFFTFLITRNPTKENSEIEKDASTRKESLKAKQIILIFMFAIFFILYVGLEVTCGGFLSLFLTRALCWNNQQSALLTSLFWSGTGIGRLIGALISIKMSPQRMLVGNLTVTILAFTLMATLAELHPAVMWCATALAGIGVSTIYPSAYLWCSRYVKPTGFVTGLFLFAGSVGSMCLPLLTGYMFEHMTPWLFIYQMVTASACLLVIYVSVLLYVTKYMKEIISQSEPCVAQGEATEKLTVQKQ